MKRRTLCGYGADPGGDRGVRAVCTHAAEPCTCRTASIPRRFASSSWLSQDDPKDDKAHFMIGVAYSNMDSVGARVRALHESEGARPQEGSRLRQQHPEQLRASTTSWGRTRSRRPTSRPRRTSSTWRRRPIRSSPAATTTWPCRTRAWRETRLDLLREDAHRGRQGARARRRVGSQLHARAAARRRASWSISASPDEAVARMQTTIDEDPSKYPAGRRDG